MKLIDLNIQLNTRFWYSPSQLKIFLLFFFLFVFLGSFFIPPFQSPDEPAHLNRAFLLSKGEIFLKTEGGVTGGYLNEGLIKYEKEFEFLPFNPNSRLSVDKFKESFSIDWSDKRSFLGLPNTAQYFPFIYIPQAVALTIGEWCSFPVAFSYYLSRLFCLLISIMIIYFAAIIYPMPVLAAACFLTPMSFFQLGSASIDGLAFSLFALVGSIFMNLACCSNTERVEKRRLLILGTFLIIVLTTTRLNFICIALLPFVLFLRSREIRFLLSSFSILVFSGLWSTYVFINVKGAITRDVSSSEMLAYYLSHPFIFVKVFINTILNYDLVRYYWKMFVGVIGWLDTFFSNYLYIFYLFIFLVVFIIGIKNLISKKIEKWRIGFFLSLPCSFFLMYFMIAVVWSDPKMEFIDGVQGRYFTPFFILLGYFIFDANFVSHSEKISKYILLTMLSIAPMSLVRILLTRYWV